MNKETVNKLHRVYCECCEEYQKPEDEICPDCEEYLGPTEAQWRKMEKEKNS